MVFIFEEVKYGSHFSTISLYKGELQRDTIDIPTHDPN